MNYTPLGSGESPSLGTSGPAVANFQTQLNTQNAGKSGYVPLAVDGKYGPLTAAASTFKPATTSLITTGTNPANEYARNVQTLNNIIATKAAIPATTVPTANATGNSNANANTAPDTTSPTNADGTPNVSYKDAYTQALDRMAATSDQATKNLIATTQASRQNQANAINSKYDDMKSGLFSLGVSTGKLQTTPDLVYGSEMQADNERASKLQTLDQEEAKTILAAQEASANKDNTALREKLAYIKTLQNQKLDVLKNTASTLNAEKTIATDTATAIYSQLQTMPEDQKIPFLKEVASQNGIDLGTLTAQVNKLATKGSKSSAAGSTKSLNTLASNISKIFSNSEKDKNGYSVLGDDGYIDPNAYTAAYQAWINGGGAANTFVSKFPAAKYINPASITNLPKNLQPTAKASSSSKAYG